MSLKLGKNIDKIIAITVLNNDAVISNRYLLKIPRRTNN
jgi:hypothetical protein